MGYVLQWLPSSAPIAWASVVIFLDDHEPAHVHVFGDGQAKINLATADGAPELVWAYGMKRGDVRRTMQLVADHRDRLLATWRDIHG